MSSSEILGVFPRDYADYLPKSYKYYVPDKRFETLCMGLRHKILLVTFSAFCSFPSLFWLFFLFDTSKKYLAFLRGVPGFFELLIFSFFQLFPLVQAKKSYLWKCWCRNVIIHPIFRYKAMIELYRQNFRSLEWLVITKYGNSTSISWFLALVPSKNIRKNKFKHKLCAAISVKFI